MMTFNRPTVPKLILGKQRAFGRLWKDKLDRKKLGHIQNATFVWYVVTNGQKFNSIVFPVLWEEDRCAYCDFYRDGGSQQTIEHWKEKINFPLQAFIWKNLFPACNSCQGYKDNWESNLIRPDETGYSFNRYFVVNRLDGIISANPSANAFDKTRAEQAIRIYGFNKGDIPSLRKKCYKAWHKNVQSDPLFANNLSYRFLW